MLCSPESSPLRGACHCLPISDPRQAGLWPYPEPQREHVCSPGEVSLREAAHWTGRVTGEAEQKAWRRHCLARRSRPCQAQMWARGQDAAQE